MAEPALESIEIEGFLSIRSATVSLGALNVLIGANGSGKSNLVRAFEMLGRIADGELAFFVSLNGGASTLVHEALHIYFGAIADAGNFANAHCYEQLVLDLNGLPVPANFEAMCPPP